MVGIVAVTRFCESSSAAFSSYIDYIDRNEAVRKDSVEKYNLFDEYTEYMDDELKTIREEGRNLERVSALFTKDKDILSSEDKKGLKELFKTAQTNGSNMWQTVISFDNAYLAENGIYSPSDDTLNESLLRQAGRKAINEMLKKEGLENATWTASFHRNTDNIHIHIATVEPIPMREKREYILYERDSEGKLPKDEYGKPIKIPMLDKDGNALTYTGYKGTFKAKSIEALKSTLRSELENNRETYSEITRLIRETIITDKNQKTLLNNPLFTDKMEELYKELKNSGVPRKNWNYNQNQIKDCRQKINDLSDFFIKTYHQDDFASFMSKIEREASRQTKTYGGNTNDYINNTLYGKEGLYARLGNAILKELRSFDRNISDKRVIVNVAEKLLDPNSRNYSPSEGLSILEEQANMGNTFAQNSLGLIYLKGEVVPKDIDRAKEYFNRSSDNGDAFGYKMKEKLNTQNGEGFRNPSIGPSSGSSSSLGIYEIRKGLRQLERELNRSYETARNIKEQEELQQEIDARGEEI